MIFSRTLAFLPEPWNSVERIRQKNTCLSPDKENNIHLSPDKENYDDNDNDWICHDNDTNDIHNHNNVDMLQR